MQKVLTRQTVADYNDRNIKVIELDEKPIITDLAKEAMRQFGITVRVGKSSMGSSQNVKTVNEPVSEELSHPTARILGTPNINKPPFKEIIRSGRKLVSTFIGTPHPVMTEFIGHLGFDFVCIDAEHNAMSMETVQKMLQGLQGTPTYGMVRVPMISYEYITNALDIGADALLVPQIRTMDDMRRIREYCLYPPNGRRGVGPSRLWDYGDSIGQIGAPGDIDYTTNIIPQIETVQAVENLDEIVQADFVDMFFIGPGDLSMDMGIFAQFDNPKLTDTIMMIREKTAKAGKRLGVFAGNFEAAKNWLNKGFDMVIINSELALLGGTVREGMQKLK